MTHLIDDGRPLTVRKVLVQDIESLQTLVDHFADVCVLILPPCTHPTEYRNALQDIGPAVARVLQNLGPNATLVTVGEVIDLVQVQAHMPPEGRYQNWIAIMRTAPYTFVNGALPNQHFGALIQTRYKQSLRHAKTRIAYTYCPACNKTTKDYGGKKHTYHHYGTLMSDVWRDIQCDLGGDIEPIIERFRDMFGISPYQELLVLDCRDTNLHRSFIQYGEVDWNASFVREPRAACEYDVASRSASQANFFENLDIWSTSTFTGDAAESKLPTHMRNQILEGDCLEWLEQIPNDSIDFVFTDPPYNLGKKYSGYSDDLEIKEYFDWCDRWIAELARTLKPGCTLALLNIPLWAIRHFLFMDSILRFQNWIVWDALAFPVRFIMPAHYTILAFSKGPPRELPGLIGESQPTSVADAPAWFKALEPLADGYCLRARCVKTRQASQLNDRGPLADVWGDIHRLKHNSRRVDHPTQLPPHLMYRLISIFTKRGETILDCFNGAGTTTLTAHQLGRQYLGIENSPKYCDMARNRHQEILSGLNPFRKKKRTLTAKNSPVPRLPKQQYEIPKKTLQLEVRRVARELGHLPTRDELAVHGQYPIKYYDEYFISWGEVCAAARTTGMTEERPFQEGSTDSSQVTTQLSFELNKKD